MNVIEFPTADRPIMEAEVDKLHSEAFRDLEGRIDDSAIMASIALQMVEPAIGGREDKHEKAIFAVGKAEIKKGSVTNPGFDPDGIAEAEPATVARTVKRSKRENGLAFALLLALPAARAKLNLTRKYLSTLT
jgi:hypothetical protein